MVLATQNPADLDYKGLSNTGTWFIGRLQAERDKLRVLEGLDSAAAAQSARFDRQEMDRILSGLGKRTFLMHNVHEDHPQVFQVRWALSYLRGPLTRQQIKQLMDPVRPAPAEAPPRPRAATGRSPPRNRLRRRTQRAPVASPRGAPVLRPAARQATAGQHAALPADDRRMRRRLFQRRQVGRLAAPSQSRCWPHFAPMR